MRKVLQAATKLQKKKGDSYLGANLLCAIAATRTVDLPAMVCSHLLR